MEVCALPSALVRSPAASPRRATNVTLPEALLNEAREMGINLSQACERGVAEAVTDARRRRWLEENQAAIEAWNGHVAEHGLPLATYRQF
jgi:antitoxin CcdA